MLFQQRIGMSKARALLVLSFNAIQPKSRRNKKSNHLIYL